MNEVGDVFCQLLGDYTLPEGSIIAISSLSQLQSEGLSSYIEAAIRETNRFSSMFRGTVNVIPILPIPTAGVADLSTISRLADLCDWFGSNSNYGLQEFISSIKRLMVSSGSAHLPIPPHRLRIPISLVTGYSSAVWEFPGKPALPSTLPPLSAAGELAIIHPLMTGLSHKFKIEVDTRPSCCRDLCLPPAAALSEEKTESVIVIGGSNADRLATALASLGLDPDTVTSGGWTISHDSISDILDHVEALCITLPPSAPVIIYGLDNGSFMEVNRDGIQSVIRKHEDGRYHVVGELSVSPDVTISAAVANLRRLLKKLGNRTVYIITPLPRYINESCCTLANHCTHRAFQRVT